MEKIGIITDEAADLPREIIEKYKITIIPVKLDWPDIENLPGENTFQKMRELERRGIKSFGKTSQPSPKDFIDKYKEQLEKFENVICITLTSKHSGTFNSAIQGKNFLSPEEQKRVFVIDSLHASASQALLVLKTVDLIESKKEAKDIVKELEEFRSKIKLFAMFQDPKWLEASGRISSLVGNLLRNLVSRGIRAMLTFRKGKLTPGGIKIHATDTVSVLFKQFDKENQKPKDENKKIRVVITHGDDFASAKRLDVSDNVFSVKLAKKIPMAYIIIGILGVAVIAIAFIIIRKKIVKKSK